MRRLWENGWGWSLLGTGGITLAALLVPFRPFGCWLILGSFAGVLLRSLTELAWAIWSKPPQKVRHRKRLVLLLFPLSAAAFWSLVVLCHCGTREHSRRNACLANQKMILLALNAYETRWHTLPPDLATLVRSRCLNREELQCPSVQAQRPTPPAERCDYLYFRPDSMATAPNRLILIDKPENHGGQYRNRGYAAGYAEPHTVDYQGPIW